MSADGDRRTTLLFFLGVLLLYVAFSPLTVAGMGYLGEEMGACHQIMDAGSSHPHPVDWPRNGAVGLAFQCPFLAVSHAVSGPSAAPEERWLSIQPMLATALLVTVLFVWCSRLAGSRTWGFLLALAAGFATMLWPYAYIGLETTQSLFLLLAAYLALGTTRRLTWPRALAFGLCAGIALSAKSGGILLAPAVAYLAWRLSKAPSRGEGESPGAVAKAAAGVLLLALIYAVNAHIRALAWVRFGGTVSFARNWLVIEPISPFLHFVGFLGSPNKGLIVFAPLAILALVLLPRAFAADRPVAIFAGLTFLGLAGSLSLLEMWADETWGPRYLHSAIAPLVLCLAAAKQARPWRLRREPAFLAAAAVGLCVSFLGVLFYYGALHVVASDSTPLTMQALQGDTTWNHVLFNARLLNAWRHQRRGVEPVPRFLEPGRGWDAQARPRLPEWKKVDLNALAQPQPLLIRLWGYDLERSLQILCRVCLLAGLGLVAWCAWVCRGSLSRGS